MDNEKLLHDLIVDSLRKKLSREYKEIEVNSDGGPDLRLSNHGMLLAVVEVETEESITPLKADQWKAMKQPGVKLILMVPKSSRVQATELLWQKGIADSVSLGTYEISLNMP
ncbi:MAG: hypothetical protein HGA78_10035 [Nitrospirales bacterium]|nr:hypothetical protein [Nitrospirales bacterium]